VRTVAQERENGQNRPDAIHTGVLASSSSTCASRSLPKNISSPMKKVGMPKAPRRLAASVVGGSPPRTSGSTPASGAVYTG
jgi:hypothetical protein